MMTKRIAPWEGTKRSNRSSKNKSRSATISLKKIPRRKDTITRTVKIVKKVSLQAKKRKNQRESPHSFNNNRPSVEVEEPSIINHWLPMQVIYKMDEPWIIIESKKISMTPMTMRCVSTHRSMFSQTLPRGNFLVSINSREDNPLKPSIWQTMRKESISILSIPLVGLSRPRSRVPNSRYTAQEPCQWRKH